MNFLIFIILGLFFVKHISVFPGRFSCAFLKNPDKVGHISDPYLLGDLLDLHLGAVKIPYGAADPFLIYIRSKGGIHLLAEKL